MIDFKLNSGKAISKKFQDLEINTFLDAMNFIKNLPYGRNSNKENPTLVLSENKGTCSSKHALLKILADENNHKNVKLILGIFRMNNFNTPKVQKTLFAHHLNYLPEAHNYLRINNKTYDCTTKNSSELNFINDLILEIEIQPHQITEFKTNYHKEFLKNWIKGKPFTIDELWKIREQCIGDLSS